MDIASIIATNPLSDMPSYCEESRNIYNGNMQENKMGSFILLSMGLIRTLRQQVYHLAQITRECMRATKVMELHLRSKGMMVSL